VRHNFTLGHSIAHLQDSRAAVSTFPLDNPIHVSSRFEGEAHLREWINVCGVPESAALFERARGANAHRNWLMRW